MVVKENRMWIVETYSGIAYIGRNLQQKTLKQARKGKFWNWTSKSLGYPVVFKDKATAQKFARKIRSPKILNRIEGTKVYVLEVEFYKGEMEAD